MDSTYPSTLGLTSPIDLPTELVQIIFEHAAARDRPTALALARVSSWSRDWVDPILYHTVHLAHAADVTSFLARPHSSTDVGLFRTNGMGTPRQSLAKLVKNLAIATSGPAAGVQEVLSLCSGAINVALLADWGPARRSSITSASKSKPASTIPSPYLTVSTSGALREQHLLGLPAFSLAGLDLPPLSPALTHLRVRFPPGVPASRFPIASLPPNLTHLALVCRAKDAGQELDTLLDGLLAARPMNTTDSKGEDEREEANGGLQVVLVQIGTSASAVHRLNARAEKKLRLSRAPAGLEGEEQTVETKHGGLRVVAEEFRGSLMCEWEIGARLGKGVWDNARAIVEGRLSKARTMTLVGADEEAL